MDLALASAPAPQARSFGEHLRHWRQRRRMSQLDLAGEADVSTRHLSFVETGRSVPSREMVLRLAERLNIPLRERNALLVAAGYAPCTGNVRSTTRPWRRRARRCS
jgi:transcriptional regulator with XRE-family HTH domain